MNQTKSNRNTPRADKFESRWEKLIEVIYVEVEKQFEHGVRETRELGMMLSMTTNERRLRLAVEKLRGMGGEAEEISLEQHQEMIWMRFGMPPEQRRLHREQLLRGHDSTAGAVEATPGTE